MADLETKNLIEIIAGVLLFVVVTAGAVIFFKDYIIDFFKNMFGIEEVFLAVIR